MLIFLHSVLKFSHRNYSISLNSTGDPLRHINALGIHLYHFAYKSSNSILQSVLTLYYISILILYMYSFTSNKKRLIFDA